MGGEVEWRHLDGSGTLAPLQIPLKQPSSCFPEGPSTLVSPTAGAHARAMQNIATDERPIVVGVDDLPWPSTPCAGRQAKRSCKAWLSRWCTTWEPPYSISGVGSILSPRKLAPYRDHARTVLDQAIHEESAAVETSPAIIPELRQGYRLPSCWRRRTTRSCWSSARGASVP